MDPQIERSRHFLTWAMDGKPNSTISLNHPQFHERRLEISLQNTTTKDFRIRRFFGISDAPIIRLIHPGIQWLIPQFSKKDTFFSNLGISIPWHFPCHFPCHFHIQKHGIFQHKSPMWPCRRRRSRALWDEWNKAKPRRFRWVWTESHGFFPIQEIPKRDKKGTSYGTKVSLSDDPKNMYYHLVMTNIAMENHHV